MDIDKINDELITRGKELIAEFDSESDKTQMLAPVINLLERSANINRFEEKLLLVIDDVLIKHPYSNDTEKNNAIEIFKLTITTLKQDYIRGTDSFPK